MPVEIVIKSEKPQQWINLIEEELKEEEGKLKEAGPEDLNTQYHQPK